MPLEDESQYTPHWRSALYALRLIGRLHELRSQDPKPSGQEESITPLTGIERKQIIIKRRKVDRYGNDQKGTRLIK